MALNFHLGDKVVCIHKPVGGYGNECLPEKGGVYTIRGFDEFTAGIGIVLEEIINRHGLYDYGRTVEPHFCTTCFRPLKTTDISIFTKMLAPTPREREPA